jgi:tol-pal system protein YbgF
MGWTQRYRYCLGGLALLAGPLCAVGQEYIDLEAERLRQQQSESPYGSASAVPSAPEPLPSDSAASSAGELFYQLQLLQQEVMELRGKVEEQGYQIRQFKEQSLERYMDLDRRLKEGGGSTPDPGSEASTSTAKPAGQELAGEADAYRAAYSQVRSQQFQGAVSAFKQFLVNFPNGRYAANAHYWLGELYLVIVPPDDESARREFNLLLEDYPDNSKAPDALYKLGKIYFDRGDANRAREYFDRVINEFGDSGSSAVKLARDFIGSNY